MKKYLWAIIAGVCVLALLIVVGALFIPRLFSSTDAGVEDVELIPAHWWKTEMTEQQLSALGTLWGKDVTAAQLLQALWPDVLQQMPEEAATTYEKHQVRWPTQKYEDWQGEMIAGGAGVSHEEGMMLYYYYLGSHESEQITFLTSVERGFTEDRMYRVSLYVDVRQE
jgi:hypothetical protein